MIRNIIKSIIQFDSTYGTYGMLRIRCQCVQTVT